MATNDPGIPVNCDLQRRRGDTWPLAIQLLQAGTTDPLIPAGIAGYTFKLAVDTEKEPGGSVSSVTNVFERAGTITDAPLNKVEFALSDSEANLIPGQYYYEIEMTDTSSDRRTLMYGKWIVKQDIAKGA
jgi:hypothetical protein